MGKTLLAAVCRIGLTCLLLALLVPALAAHAAPMVPPEKLPDAPGRGGGLSVVLKDISGRRADVIAMQRELVARPAIGPEAGGEGEEPKAAWLLGMLREKGLRHVERLDSVGRVRSLDPETSPVNVRPNIIVRHPGSGGLETGGTLWIICHLHVPPPGPPDKWKGPPHTLRVEGDILYGRGVMDNYQSITAAILLFESLARNSVTPPMNLGLVLHSQNSGIRHVLETRPELFKPGDLIVVPDFGVSDGSEMGVAEKGLLWFRFTVTGPQRHAAMGNMESALVAGARLIIALDSLKERFPGDDPLFTRPKASFTPTRARTDDGGINSVAASFTLYLDCRFPPAHSLEEVEQGVRHLAAELAGRTRTDIAVERLLAYPALPPTRMDSPVARALQRAIRTELPAIKAVKPVGIDITTAASFFRDKGFPVAAWAKFDSPNRHQPNEAARISDHLTEARVMARLLFDPEALKEAPTVPPARGADTAGP